MDCSAPLLQWAGWITTVILGLGGYAISSLGWFIQGRQASNLALQNQINSAIDQCHVALVSFEDAVFSFWSEPNSSVRLDELINLHRRCLSALKQLHQLRAFEMPHLALGELRKYATLDAENAQRPLDYKSLRLKKFSRAVTKITDSPFLLKSWHGVSSPGKT